jgi:hypothetical protein
MQAIKDLADRLDGKPAQILEQPRHADFCVSRHGWVCHEVNVAAYFYWFVTQVLYSITKHAMRKVPVK